MSTINPQWAEYNRVNNEGGEGYNPYPQYLGESDDEPMWSVLEGKASALLNRLNRTPVESAEYKRIEAEHKATLAAYTDAVAAARARGEW